MRKTTVFILAFTVFTAFAPAAWAVDPVEVFIDGRDPAFLVVQGVGSDTPEQARQEMAGYAILEGISLIPWATFLSDTQNILKPHIIKNEYPASNTALVLLTLVKSFPGKPFAVTWNGGLAVGFFDYQLAVRNYKAFVGDAALYEAARASRDTDPLNPKTQLAKLLSP